MTLKVRVNSLDEVAEPFRGEYVPDGDGFVLDISGDAPGLVAMRGARDNEKDAHKQTKARLRELETELDTLRNDNASGRGSVEANNKSWQTKYDNRVKELTDEIATLTGAVSGLTVGQTVTAISGRLFIVPDAMEHHVRNRLTTEMVDGKPVTRVLDKDGKPSVLTVEDLEKEFRQRKDWAPFLKGGEGSGGGGHNPPPGIKKFKQGDDPKTMSEQERLDLLNSDPTAFYKLFPKKGA